MRKRLHAFGVDDRNDRAQDLLRSGRRSELVTILRRVDRCIRRVESGRSPRLTKSYFTPLPTLTIKTRAKPGIRYAAGIGPTV